MSKAKEKKLARKARKNRRERLAHSIALTYESLSSHLRYSVKTPKGVDANEEFHAAAVRDYAFVLQTIAVELYLLVEQDFKKTTTPVSYEIPRQN